MIVRRIALFAGVVALIVATAGLLVPLSVSPEGESSVGCGSAIAPDLSAARANDDGSAANIPVPGGIVVDTKFTRLCQLDLEDRRIWTITLAAVGALAVIGALVLGALSNRRTPTP
ncbi:hypothetical protein MGALJ_42440 [Mycobacterium gallinarum]|uniref:Aminopeptidase n=1 Tax=Mycobacterium gallinarum TaxID=39689 RepID=A0A9W4B625_9MYCO|nr:hypothetical protein MGALJ_42440 [Mycobacterium gallinarum]